MRDVRRDGLSINVPVYFEIRRWLNDYFAARARRAEQSGHEVARGDKLGAGNAMADVVCWLASLCDADIERICREGGAIRAEQDRMDPEYGKAPGVIEPMMIRRRTGSVFAPEPSGVPVGPGDAGRGGRPAKPGVRLLGSYRRARKDGRGEHEARSEGDAEPGHVLP